MTAEQIREVVESVSGFDISEKNRARPIVDARHVYYHLCLTYGKKEIVTDKNIYYKDYSTLELAKTMNQTHATVVVARKKILGLLEVNDSIMKLYEDCKSLVVNEEEIADEQKTQDPILLKLLHQQEINVLKNKHKLELKAIRDNINSPFVKELLTIPYVFQEEFLTTRFRPYLKLIESGRRNYKNIRDIEVVC